MKDRNVPDGVLKGLEDAKPGEYLTDALTTKAEQFIEANKDKPFFVYLPHYAVHIPLKAKDEILAKYKEDRGYDRRSADNGSYSTGPCWSCARPARVSGAAGA